MMKMKDDQVFVFSLVMEHRWNEIDTGKLKYTGKNLSQCHFVHHKIPHGLTLDRSRASAVGSCQLLAEPVGSRHIANVQGKLR
jgi:hypothetical protein